MKSYLKTIGIVIAVIVVAIAIFFGTEYYRYRQSPDYIAEQYFKQLEEAYKNDAYGGSTPEETLQLFIDALKKGDTELAVRYFLISEQDKWRENLNKIKGTGQLDAMISDLRRAERNKSSSEEQVFFTAGNQKNEAVLDVDLVKLSTGKWKIRGL